MMNTSKIMVHGVIITAIIVAIYIIWQHFIYREPVQTKTVVLSAYEIQISRASYGLDCLDYFAQGLQPMAGTSSYDIDRYKKKLRANNVLSVVSKRCNGRPKCSIKVTPGELGFKGYPECGMEKLDIEFRCFAVDNLRKLSFKPGKNAEIDCDQYVVKDE